MIILLAGLLDVPRNLYESADIEGASAWQRFRHITIPMLTPVIFFTLVIGIITGSSTSPRPTSRSAASRGDRRLPAELPALLRGLALPAGVRLLPHGLRVRDGLGAVRGHHGAARSCSQELESLGALRGGSAMSAVEAPVRLPTPPDGGRARPPPPLPVRVAKHSLLIAVSFAFCSRSSSCSDGLMTDHQALTSALAAPVPLVELPQRVRRRPLWRTPGTRSCSPAVVDRRGASCVPVAYALRASVARAHACSCSCSRR